MTEPQQSFPGPPDDGPGHRNVGRDRVGPTAGAAGPLTERGRGRQNSLWSDAWGAAQAQPAVLDRLGPRGVLRDHGDRAVAVLPWRRPPDCNLSNSKAAPSAEHWLGFDQQGCDYLANVAYGARSSLQIGLLAVLGVLVLGIIIGAVAGYYGGFADSLLARITDIFFALPLVLGALILLRVAPSTGLPVLSDRGPGSRRHRAGPLRLDDGDAAGPLAGHRGQEHRLRGGGPGHGCVEHAHPDPAHPAQRGGARARLLHHRRRGADRRRRRR